LVLLIWRLALVASQLGLAIESQFLSDILFFFLAQRNERAIFSITAATNQDECARRTCDGTAK
jgi:hypothetical protein